MVYNDILMETIGISVMVFYWASIIPCKGPYIQLVIAWLKEHESHFVVLWRENAFN